MSTSSVPPVSSHVFDLVLFGATGDLAIRKLLPALYRRFVAGQIDAQSRIVGAARTDLSREAFADQTQTSISEYLGKDFNEKSWNAFSELLHYVKINADSPADYEALAALLKGQEQRTRIFFLSTAPMLFAGICEHLAAHTLVTPTSRVVLEKPLGQDLGSATSINERVGASFAEHQIYRIDHYLGKETVQNLMALRFGNMLFEPLWRRGRIQHVQITVAEQLGVGTRGQFYDQTGALRDMVQNHLLQLLCILAMEPPATSSADAVRDEKLKVLRALRPLAGKDVAEKTVRGQYKAGAAAGSPVVGYLNEGGIPGDSRTETFVAIKVEIDSWRWAGVPFYLRTGKRLQDKLAEIVVTFEEVPHSIFETPTHNRSNNKLVLRLQPDENIMLTLLAKSPGGGMRLKPVALNLDLADSSKHRHLDAYERLLMDVVQGNLTLFMRRDELDAAWRWIDPIREAWQQHDDRPKAYIAGTWGPSASSALIERDNFSWHDEG